MPDALAQALFDYTERHPGEGALRTPIDTLAIIRSDRPKPPSHILYQPAMCIVAQGAKWATFGDHRLEYRAGQALVVGIDTPSTGQVVEASPDRPCLVMVFGLDLEMLRSVAEGLQTPPTPGGETGRSVLVTDFQGPLADCALRLVRLLDTPQAIGTLYPGIMREIAYWLLTGPHGGEIARMAAPNGPSQRVLGALRSLQRRFREPLSIGDLAAVAQMSPSAFHRQFKALTSQTPLQYQKQLRLMEARRLMIAGGANVEAACFEVGYESPSQFSREYARLFGAPPKRDAGRLLTLLREDRAAETELLAAVG